ncbi:MAG: class I SAM-dependent methyltransferase [Halanaerobiales bacterium]|nr:class I SAM-dependent methyltransferase [Halanaerobiales bacterium]
MSENNKKGAEFFNKRAEDWDDNVPQKSIEVAKDFVKKYKIGKNDSILDVGCGTGILYSVLEEKKFTYYLGIDIASKMLDVFKEKFPQANVKRIDFETNIKLDKTFDFVIVFDTIPHLQKIDMVFKNAYKQLKVGGNFLIVHSKTRKALKEHHDEIGHNQDDPIPTDEVLRLMSWTYGFEEMLIKDDDYFLFSAKKKR